MPLSNISTALPVPSLVDYCMENKLNCRFIQLHFTDLPDYTVFDIVRLAHDKRRQLLSAGVIDIRHVPEDFKLSEKQRQQIRAAKQNEVIIDRERLTKCIDGWEYPLHFLDYETFSYAIPSLMGSSRSSRCVFSILCTRSMNPEAR